MRGFNFVSTLLTIISLFTMNVLSAQNDGINLSENKEAFSKLIFYDYRGTNAGDLALGSAVMNGDYQNPLFEFYFKAGYKRFLSDHFNIGFSFNKYNLAFEDVYDEGFMSFDVNIEYLLYPYKRWSPFIAGGYGFNASNYFNSTSTKVQGAIGIEYIVYGQLGLKLFGEYNYNFGDELDGLEAGASDDVFYRIGFGFNVYFGGKKQKQKRLSEIKTVIKSRPITIEE